MLLPWQQASTLFRKPVPIHRAIDLALDACQGALEDRRSSSQHAHSEAAPRMTQCMLFDPDYFTHARSDTRSTLIFRRICVRLVPSHHGNVLKSGGSTARHLPRSNTHVRVRCCHGVPAAIADPCHLRCGRAQCIFRLGAAPMLSEKSCPPRNTSPMSARANALNDGLCRGSNSTHRSLS